MAALLRFDVLDTPPDPDFDDLAQLAAHVCATPMALVSLVDVDRQWFKARVGLDVCSTDRQSSFCAHALARDDVMVVPDSLLDERFVDNPLVTGSPGIRAYAGAPLVTADGAVLGTLCVLDVAPRTFTPEQLALLSALARQVVSQLESRRHAALLADELAQRLALQERLASTSRLLEGVLSHTDVIVFAKDLDGRFLLANDALHGLIGRARGEVLGQTDFDLFPRDKALEYRANDQQVTQTGTRQVFAEVATSPDGTERHFLSTKFALRDADGRVYAVAGISTDVTDLAAARRGAVDSEQRWRALVEHSPVAVAVYSAADLRFRYANPRAATLYGAGSVAGLLGRSYLDVVPDAARDDFLRQLSRILDGTPLLGHEGQIVGLDGQRHDVEVNASLVTFGDEAAVQVELRDITARVASDRALQSSEARFRALVTSAPVAIAEALVDGTLVSVNPQLCRLLGYRAEELVGRPARMLTVDDGVVRGDLPSLFTDQDRYSNERTYRRKDGSTLPCLVSAGLVRDAEGRPDRVVGMIIDISEQVVAREALLAAHDELEQAVLHDPLTGLPNRSLLADRLRLALARGARTQHPAAVLFCDLDGFKAVNDTAGHAAGDRVLVVSAQRLSAALRPHDTVARVGGDEFVVVLEPGPDAAADLDMTAEAQGVARRLRDALAEPVRDGARQHRVTVSIGIAVAVPGDDPDTLLRRADGALYCAKRTGKDRAAVWEPESADASV